ncbi:MAG: diphthine--ammonia ligase [Candidatus Diapherotrites archaeon]|nr:diphthine--ammonia ligase [Candidatus Diapherotrites archaeon]
MCGITGFFNYGGAEKLAERALELMHNRGIDAKGIYAPDSENALGHCLHAVVGFVKQPLVGKGALAANCEIYNWKELNVKYKFGAKNDAELLLKLLDKKGANEIKQVLSELHGTYAFAYLRDGKIAIARDLIGVKPLWYALDADGKFCFASEKKVIEALAGQNALELNPREALVYDIKRRKLDSLKREFFRLGKENKFNLQQNAEKIRELLSNAMKMRIPERKFGLLFSGGIDSALIAGALKEGRQKFRCYFAFIGGDSRPKDLEYAQGAAKALGIELELVRVEMDEFEKELPKIVNLIESANPTRVGVASVNYFACRKAHADGCKVIFSGLGADELFAGYARFKESKNINADCLSALMQMHENDLYRDDVASMENSVELRLPFLDSELAGFALNVPEKFKINKSGNKAVLREIGKGIGLPKEIYERKKLAAQYGSNFDRAIEKLARKHGHKRKSEFLASMLHNKNLRLGALFSSGKDSNYALYEMQRQNYGIACLITIKSKNPDSYMFHSANIGIAKLQAQALGIPIIEVESAGEKENELGDLERALKIARDKFRINGIVTGAIVSNYQRKRIENAADENGLRVFSPLWQKNQELELKEIVDSGFHFIITKIACAGIGKEWLGKEIGIKEAEQLIALGRKSGFNAAGEGGEYETLVLDAPNFRKKIVIGKYEIKSTGEFSHELVINFSSATLAKK